MFSWEHVIIINQ